MDHHAGTTSEGIPQHAGKIDSASTGSEVFSCGACALLMTRAEYRSSYYILTPLKHLMVLRFDALCHDPRDRVFAVMGLLSAHEMSMLARSFPDYTLTNDQVIVVALAHMIHAWRIPWSAVPMSSQYCRWLFLGFKVEEKGPRRTRLYIGRQKTSITRTMRLPWD